MWGKKCDFFYFFLRRGGIADGDVFLRVLFEQKLNRIGFKIIY